MFDPPKAAAWLAALVIALLGLSALGGEHPIFDAHIHYSHDAWADYPVPAAIERLRAAGVMRALVFSSNDDGTQQLYQAAPELIIPALRPYRQRSELTTWTRDESVPGYLESRLRQYRYVAIGEFHVHGVQADAPVVRRVLALARQHGLMLHVHADADTLERLYLHDPSARILWAHAGFEGPARVAALLARHRNLWADLSMRGDIAAEGKLRPDWHSVLIKHPDRFMVGTDTYTPSRWDQVGAHARWARGWLADLPQEVAERIAWRNGEEVLTAAFIAVSNRQSADSGAQPR